VVGGRDKTLLKTTSIAARIATMRYALLAATLFAAGCSSSTEKGPVFASSATRPTYAVSYTDEIEASRKAISDAREREKSLATGLGAHVEELKRTDWDKVQEIVDDSDQAGRSADFADAFAEAKAVKKFWEGEKEIITSKVAGNAQHTAKQAGCEAEVGGAAAFALNDAVTKQIQKRLRSRNEAFLVMDRYKSSLGTQNVATLEKLADETAEASYDVHVAMIVARNDLRRMVAEKDEVKKTIDRFVQEENAYQAEHGRTEAEKKASSERIAAANKAKADVDAAVAQADAAAKQADQVIEAANKDYEDAVTKLRAKIAERKKSDSSVPKEKAAAPIARTTL
jgi:hypothetical protein